VGVSVGYSWIRRRDLVSNDGLTVVPHLRHVAWRVIPRRLRSVGSLVWSEESIVFWWLDGDRFQRSDHEETHGREPFSRFSLHLTFPLPRKSPSGEFVKSMPPEDLPFREFTSPPSVGFRYLLLPSEDLLPTLLWAHCMFLFPSLV